MEREREYHPRMEEMTDSSGNVFADLGLPDADVRALKSTLAIHIRLLIEAQGWTQAEAAAQLGLDQPKISHLLRGRLQGFSLERLLTIVNRLGHDIEVRIDPEEVAPEQAHLRVQMA